VDERDWLGYTALMLAVRCANYSAAAVLLDDGQASTTVRDNEYHRTAVEWAEQSKPLSSSLQQRTSRSDERAHTMHISFYRATRMYSVNYAVARCLSVRLSVTRRYFV